MPVYTFLALQKWEGPKGPWNSNSSKLREEIHPDQGHNYHVAYDVLSFKSKWGGGVFFVSNLNNSMGASVGKPWRKKKESWSYHKAERLAVRFGSLQTYRPLQLEGTLEA